MNALHKRYAELQERLKVTMQEMQVIEKQLPQNNKRCMYGGYDAAIKALQELQKADNEQFQSQHE